MTGAYSRSKGARGERDVCAKLYAHLGIKFSRNLKQYQESQLGDIEPLAGPYLLEVKNCARLALPAWWRQACAASARHPQSPLPCVAFKDRLKWWFLVPQDGVGEAWRNDVDFAARLSLRGFCFAVREQT